MNFRSPLPTSSVNTRIWLSFLLVSVALCGCSTDSGTAIGATGTGTSAQIAVTIKTPAQSDPVAVVFGQVTVTGSIKGDAGVKITAKSAVQATFGDKWPKATQCALSGNNFSCVMDSTVRDPTDTKNVKPLFGCNEAVQISVTATGTDATGADAGGVATVDVEVDNCAPITTLQTPLDGALFVGELQIVGKASDQRLKSGTLTVVDSKTGASVLPASATAGWTLPADAASSGTWRVRTKLDLSAATSTQFLTITLTVTDQSGQKQESTVHVTSIKRPSFLGNTGDADQFVVDEIADEQGRTHPAFGLITDVAFGGTKTDKVDLVGFTVDPTPTSDNLTDAVVATDDGVYIRAGMPPTDAVGHVVEKAPGVYQHSRHFENLLPSQKLAQYRVIHGQALTHVVRVFLQDLDDDGDQDILAVGNASGKGVVWAILNLTAMVQKYGPAPDFKPLYAQTTTKDDNGKTVTADDLNKPLLVPIRGFKLADTHELPASAISAEVADLNMDNHPDLLIGTNEPGVGLMTLLVSKVTPMCTAIVSKKIPNDDPKAEDAFADQIEDVPCNPAKATEDKDDPLARRYAASDGSLAWKQLKKAQIFDVAVNVAEHKGVTGISSIAVGDFFADAKPDPPKFIPDVCVGELERPIVSCYRNVLKNGVLDQAIDSYQFQQASDTIAIVAVDFDKDNTPDLVVRSDSGEWLSWLRGDHNGKFQFSEFAEKPNVVKHERVLGFRNASMSVGAIGLNKEPYLLLGNGREITVIPVSTANFGSTSDELFLQCFRAWIGGGAMGSVGAVDVDGDGVLDLYGVERSEPPGIAVALGESDANNKFDGNFIAPDSHHVCTINKVTHGFAPDLIKAAAVVDFSKGETDKKPELVVATQTSYSAFPSGIGTWIVDGDEIPLPVWDFAVFMNDTGRVSFAPRQFEFAPYNQPNGSTTSGQNNTVIDFGDIRAMRFADINGDSIADMVVARDGPDYTAGVPAPTKADCGQCLFVEPNETKNDFGIDGPKADSPNFPGDCCKNFLAKGDESKSHPLVGFGGGAPLSRASAFSFLSNGSGPLGMDKNCTPLPVAQSGASPAHVCDRYPAYGFAAGRNIADIRLIDVDGDKKTDLITGMDEIGAPCFKKDDSPLNAPYHAPRIRVFQNSGKGVFLPQSINTPKGADDRDTVKLSVCNTVGIPLALPVSYRIMPNGLSQLQTGPWPNSASTTDPKTLDATTIFALGLTFGEVAVVPHDSKFRYLTGTMTPLGPDVHSFAVRDVNQDLVADILAILSGDISYLNGKQDANPGKGSFPTKATVVAEDQTANWMDIGDVNHDGFQDFIALEASGVVRFYLGVGASGSDTTPSFLLYEGKVRAGVDAVDTTIADMDNDGCMDLVVRSKYNVAVLHNEGIGCKGLLAAHLGQ